MVQFSSREEDAMSRSQDPRSPRRWYGGAQGWDSHPGLLQLPRPGTTCERRFWRSERRLNRRRGRLAAANRRDRRHAFDSQRDGSQVWTEQPRIVPFSKEERRQGWKGGRIMLGDEVLVTYALGLADDALKLVRSDWRGR